MITAVAFAGWVLTIILLLGSCRIREKLEEAVKDASDSALRNKADAQGAIRLYEDARHDVEHLVDVIDSLHGGKRLARRLRERLGVVSMKGQAPDEPVRSGPLPGDPLECGVYDDEINVI